MSSSIRRETPRRTSKWRTGKTANQQGAGSLQLSALFCVWGLRRSSPTARRVSGGKPGRRTAFGAWKRRSTSGSRTAGSTRTSTIAAKPSRADARAGRFRRRNGTSQKTAQGSCAETWQKYLLRISAISYIHFTYFRIPGILEVAVQAHGRELPETAERFEGFE